MDIVFIRHGRTQMNSTGRYFGAIDTEISEEGIEEIIKLKGYLHGVDFDCIFVSPMKRAIQTAKLLDRQFIIDDRLKEMNFGVFEGYTYNEICEKYPIESKDWIENHTGYKIPKGESLEEVFNRTKDFIEEISLKEHNRVLVITHGGVIRCAMSLAVGGPDYFYKFKIEHGTVNAISIKDDYTYIKCINCSSNLMETLT
jgi:alpha-ribazole phosphatase